MPYLRRQDGLCYLERREEHKIWTSVVTILAAAAAMGGANLAAAAALGAIAGTLMLRALAMRALVWAPNPPINRGNCNRGAVSFSEAECWRFFRYRRADLPTLMRELNIPAQLTIKGGRNGTVDGEYAFLYLSFRLRYPGILAEMNHNEIWGRDYTSASGFNVH